MLARACGQCNAVHKRSVLVWSCFTVSFTLCSLPHPLQRRGQQAATRARRMWTVVFMRANLKIRQRSCEALLAPKILVIHCNACHNPWQDSAHGREAHADRPGLHRLPALPCGPPGTWSDLMDSNARGEHMQHVPSPQLDMQRVLLDALSTPVIQKEPSRQTGAACTP